ncbi:MULTISPECIES: restriction endonuclease subunit S [Segatella]|uniref:Type I restriction modification DNA specificity domain protein n=2 Tax=Segatella TaxID=2974251 RepID=U2ME27_9BACT|nr:MULTISPECIES: restriction endonuclease subunit S [Segatella]EFI47433.1 type I restriction enzyme specificity protein [Segatella oris C735]ERJ99934.1 type I restriction modification DNA specificity domain protein [Segatella salivae F0493]
MTTTIDNEHKTFNVPNLRFPEFEGEWEEHGLSEFLDFKNGLNPKPEKFGKGIKFISVMDILNNTIITYDSIKACVDANNKEIDNYSVKMGDLLFQRSSETLEDVGRANVYMDEKPAIFGGFVIRGKKKGEYNPLFFKNLLETPFSRRKIIPMGAGAQHFNIGQEGLSKVKLYFAPINEQNKIAKILSLLDDRISTQNKIIEDLKKLKSAIIEIEYSSKTKTSSHIGDFIVQTSKRNKDNAIRTVLSVSNRQGFIQQSEQFENRCVASDDTSNYKIVERNDFAFNPARINVGSIARLITFEKGIVSPMYICFRTKDYATPEYLDYFFESKLFFTEIQKRLEGSVRQCLSYESLCNIPFPLLAIEVQQRIGKQLFTLAQKIKLETDFLEILHKQKQHLLRQMFI